MVLNTLGRVVCSIISVIYWKRVKKEGVYDYQKFLALVIIETFLTFHFFIILLVMSFGYKISQGRITIFHLKSIIQGGILLSLMIISTILINNMHSLWVLCTVFVFLTLICLENRITRRTIKCINNQLMIQIDLQAHSLIIMSLRTKSKIILFSKYYFFLCSLLFVIITILKLIGLFYYSQWIIQAITQSFLFFQSLVLVVYMNRDQVRKFMYDLNVMLEVPS